MHVGMSGGIPAAMNLKRANRHGLIAGSTGTGKTVTLQTLAEQFSKQGVPVFCADAKGDLSGIAISDGESGYTEFWDLFGDQGNPIRTTIGSMGPVLMARMMNLTNVQEGVLNVAFAYARDHGIELTTLSDFRELLIELSENAKDVSVTYGNVTNGSVGAIQRSLTAFEQQDGAKFFGAPPFDVFDLIQTHNGRGQINLLAADKLMERPRLYSTFLLWLMTELFRVLPEVGDLDKPKLVFFFDEAHLLFADGGKELIETVERVVRLIRSKGVGIYFVTQSPSDVPDTILAQLGNKFQHALRAFTPRDQRAVRAAAQSFRVNPTIDSYEAIMTMGVGQALVSTLDAKGIPTPVKIVKMRFPDSRVGPITPAERKSILDQSRFTGKYKLLAEPRNNKKRNRDNQPSIWPWVIGGLAAIGLSAPIWGPILIVIMFIREFSG